MNRSSLDHEQMADIALESLLARVKAASGPNRELDARLCHTLSAPQYAFVGYGAVPLEEIAESGMAPAYTASLDAALALVERVLPGWSWTGGDIRRDDGKGGCWAVLYDVGGPSDASGRGMFPTPALALLAALLSALISSAKQVERERSRDELNPAPGGEEET